MAVGLLRRARARAAAGAGLRTPLFFSNQSTALGNSDAALLDTDKAVPFSQHGGGINILNVEEVAFPGWPTPRALRVRHRGGVAPTFYWLTCNNIWPALAIGEEISFREYFYNPILDSEGNLSYANTHPWESEGGTGSVNGLFYAQHYSGYSNGTFPYLIAVDTASFPFNGWTPGGNSDPAHPGDPMPLNKNTVYMFERKWTKRGASAFDLDAKITTAVDGVLRFDKNTIKAWGGSSGQTLAANGTNLPVDDAHMSDARWGINGGFQPTNDEDVFWGGIAVCAGGFIGPYGNVDGEV